MEDVKTRGPREAGAWGRGTILRAEVMGGYWQPAEAGDYWKPWAWLDFDLAWAKDTENSIFYLFPYSDPYSLAGICFGEPFWPERSLALLLNLSD